MFQDKLTKEIAAAAAQIKTEPPKNEVNTKSVEGAVVSIMANEELKGNQHKIDANKNGKIDAHDFKLLRGKKKVEEGVKGAGVGAALGSVAGGPVGAAIGGALGHVAGEVLSSAKNKTKAIGRIIAGPSMADSKMKKEEIEMNEDDTGYQDRYAVKNGKAVKHNPARGERDEPHHVWADSPEHAVRKHAAKTAKPVKEDIEQLDEIGNTPAGQKRLLATGRRSFLHAGTKKGGKANVSDLGQKTMDRVEKRLSDKSKNTRLFHTKIKNPQAHPSDRPGLLSRAAGAVKKVLTREEIEQINELDAAAIAAYKASPASNKKSSVPHRAGPGPSKFKEKMAAVSRTAEKGHDYFGHDAKRQQSGYRGPGQSVMQTAVDKAKNSRIGKAVSGGIKAVKKAFSREEVEAIFNDFTLDEIHMFMMSEEFQNLHVESQEQIDSYLEERTLNEGFPTVADAKKRMDAKNSQFEKKKISTGTVYSRKYKSEPDDGEEAPKKAKTMKEMLNIYKNHGVESLVENLMIEEPSQDEYKKESEVAQAKSEGKIRNDRGVAKPASQGVRMEEVEQIDELVGKGKLPSIAAYHKQKSAEAKGKMETVRSSNTKLPVPKATSAKIFAKDAESKYHSTQAKRADALMKKEEVEIEMYDADEINNVQINNIDERSLTSAEMNKREEIVKSMKKGIQGFKDRYGDRAKEVMYATATKQAKKD